MNRFFKILYITIFLFAGLSSCDDSYLERYPLDKPSDATFYSTQSELTMAVNAIYANLYYMPRNNIPLQFMLDHATDIGWDRNTDSDIQLLGKGLHTPLQSLFATTWDTYYTGIGECNMLLQNMERGKDNTDAEVFSRIEGEARFFRAYFYHLLTNYYGDIPFITEPVSYDNAELPETSKSVIVDFAISELEAASQLLPENYSGDNIGRITKGAALAVKARVALFNEKWDIASDACTRIMDLGIYSLHPDYDELTRYAGENCSEDILSIQFNRDYQSQQIPKLNMSRNGSGWSNKIPTQTLIDSYNCIDGLPINESPLYDASNPFENRDPRLNATCVVPGSTFAGFQFETHPDSVTCWDYRSYPPKRTKNNDVTNAYATFSGYCWRKYTDEENQYLSDCEINTILIRYAEVLLMYAEAKIEMNQIDGSVYDAINQVRGRVSMPDIETGKSQAELRYLVRQERKVEFAFEGLRYFDIRRWKIAHEIMPGPLYGRPERDYLAEYVPTFDPNGMPQYTYAEKLRVFDQRGFDAERDYLWPLPQKELDINPNISQNPGY